MTEFVEKVQIVGADGTPLTVNADGSIDVTGGGGGGGTVDTVVAGTNITVDATDPANPIVAAPSVVANSLFDANTVLAANTDNTPAAVTMGASTILSRLAAGNIKAATIQEVLALYEGTSFPGSPATNDRFFRTDLGLEFYYDGTRWLTTQQFSIQVGSFSNLTTSNTNDTPRPLLNQSLKTWCVSWTSSFLVLSTNTGSAYWSVILNKLNGAGSATTVGTVSSSAISVTTYATVTVAVGAEIDPAAHPVIVMNATKTAGAPGPIYATGLMVCRLIGT